MLSWRFESPLAAPVQTVWERIASLDGINDEFRPWLRMTAPKDAVLSPEAVPLEERWFRSWLLLFGVIPIDYDDLCLVSIDPPNGFRERSKLFSARRWEHDRTLIADGDGTLLVDELRAQPRPGLGPVLRVLIPAIFGHRHRQLRRASFRA